MIETKRKSLILDIVLTAIILVIGFLFWPSSEKFNQSNPRDVNKTQIKIKVKALNIRKEATVESKDIGTVYMGEIFTVIDHIDKEDYYWYHIKTKQGREGYIASDRNNEYVEVISGIVDREAPVIKSNKSILVFLDGEENYDAIECTDNVTTCSLTYENDDKIVKVTGVDEAGNTSEFNINYYKVYGLSTLYNDTNENLNVTITKTEINNNYSINVNYITNKVINSSDKSKSYVPIIDYFDEDFNKVNDVHTIVNSQQLGGACINDEKNNLKPVYNNTDIPKGSMICMNYSFVNKDEKIKYIAIGFIAADNTDKENNYLAKYYSKYFVLE